MVEKLIRMASPVNSSEFPVKADVISFTQNLAISLFPIIEGSRTTPPSYRKLKKKFKRIVKPVCKEHHLKNDELVDSFFGKLKEIKQQLDIDAKFLAANDPAASGVDEVIMAYPGFYAILVYRIAHCLAEIGIPIIPRIMSEHAHSHTGIDIHPKAKIESEFFIDHGTGIVIGETTVIGKRVKIYQGVTLGALSVSKDKASTKRHPTIEDDVIIYAGSTILGGETVIGHDSVIGGNVWLTESIPAFSMVYHESKVVIKERKNNNK
ncbi:MAG: serine acetyltransferase [Bacteroidales bacterium]|nr:serine acetyltransferase [Bacteroidales bacterium]